MLARLGYKFVACLYTRADNCNYMMRLVIVELSGERVVRMFKLPELRSTIIYDGGVFLFYMVEFRMCF